MCLNFAIHMSDISNPTKPWDISLKWTNLVYSEFFDQGDQEKQLNIPVGMLNDRETINIAKSTSGFIQFLITPSYKAFIEVYPSI